MITVFLDPDGSAEDDLGLIILAATGVVYEIQCGGVACDLRRAEGYYVPLSRLRVEPGAGKIPLLELQAPFHRGRVCLAGARLTDARLDQLRAAVESIAVWCRVDGEDRREPLRLDLQRVGEAIEAWVPVSTPGGPAILTWGNCD